MDVIAEPLDRRLKRRVNGASLLALGVRRKEFDDIRGGHSLRAIYPYDGSLYTTTLQRRR